ncbi:4-hydroxy-tetrahydrodipicolinate synthase [Sneathiella sp. CAU 1612]|uniref:4-hydroxy-tetrahydrodipicolinate synthase n=1 Tax=Sneathiella sedimenti TaxID=2816034 RepID=A0ABS3F853_9PROT|nr:4-hydroxy-tetrahydrodipicolinate synthase [Sneathiella sedimenti]MBO0334702.1 4-hydroxy-tetrahydrodipicolinate synthase [Sneathiella sedimenti]
MFRGSITALVTPFDGERVDEKSFQSFCDWQIKSGTKALVPVGTTGESPTLSHPEHDRVVELCVEVAKGRVPVMAGAGSNNTLEAIRLTKHAKAAGADAALIAMPYYNKPTQEGMYAHYKAINDAVDIPIYIYNIPGRSIVDMMPETMGRLAKLKNIVGVKDATGDVARVSLQRLHCGTDFNQLSGEDGSAIGFNAHGGNGCISVTANVAPELAAQMQEASLAGDNAKAIELQDRLMPLHRALFLESSPAPTKYALSLLGKCKPDVRMPIIPLVKDETKRAIEAAMRHAGILN